MIHWSTVCDKVFEVWSKVIKACVNGSRRSAWEFNNAVWECEEQIMQVNHLQKSFLGHFVVSNGTDFKVITRYEFELHLSQCKDFHWKRAMNMWTDKADNTDLRRKVSLCRLNTWPLIWMKLNNQRHWNRKYTGITHGKDYCASHFQTLDYM